MTDRVLIFDTTLRDGEQSPGISLNTAEKLEIAHQLARLGVDIIEAGFPIASPGDFEAVQAIAREVEGPVIAGLARANPGGHRSCLGGGHGRGATAHPHVRLDVRHPHRAPAADHARGRQGPRARGRSRRPRRSCDDVEFSPMDATRADVEFTAEVIQIALDEGATTINIPDTVGYAMPRRVRGVPRASSTSWCPACATSSLSVHCHDDLGLAVANSLRRRAGRRAAGRVRDQRHRRARRQRVARGDRDAAAHARGRRSACDTRIDTTRDRAHEPPRLAPHRLRRAAQQGDRRAQRVRARVRHPPGRRAEGAHDLRDHGRDDRRPGRQRARARQALRPPRAAPGAGGARLRRSTARR